MELKGFLEAVRNCPDELVLCLGRERHRLTADFGVYDNFGVFLNAPLEDVLEYFNQSPLYTPRQGMLDGFFGFEFKDGLARLSVKNKSPSGQETTLSVSSDEKIREAELEHAERQKRDYNLVITMHPWEGEPVRRVSQLIDLVELIEDVCTYAMDAGFPLCLPGSRGWAHDEELDRIVYFKP